MATQDVVKRETLEKIIEHRNRSLALLQQGFELLREADKEFRHASLCTKSVGIFAGLQHSDWFALESDSHLSNQRMAKLVEKCRKRIDGGTWQHIINNTRINNLMDADQACQLRKQLRETPPEVDISTATATLEQLFKNRDSTFRQSVINIFSRLSNSGYKSNGAFAVGNRMIMTGAVYHYGSLDCTARDRLSDVDRILYLMQGFSYPGKDNDAGSAVELACREARPSVDTQWLHIKIFQNGNLHIYIKEKQLINQVNKIIAEHYGQTLPTEKRHQYKHF